MKPEFLFNLATRLSELLAQSEDQFSVRFWVDDVTSPSLVRITPTESRLVAKARVRQRRSPLFKLYKVSINTRASTLAEFETDETLRILGQVILNVKRQRITASAE